MSRIHLLGTLALLAAGALAVAQAPTPGAGEVEAPREPRVGVRFEGFLPGTRDTGLDGTYAIEFRIYLSPQGGEPVWRETRDVRVAKGRMDVELGEVTPIPFELHRATFKFLGASVGGAREVYPRFAIVNTVFASPEEALRPIATPAGGERPEYAGTGARVAAATEAAASWEAALKRARESGGDLPDYRDWYADLARCERAQVLERSGHYEWVLPWVYDTASHGEYNRLFRGRYQGCEYMDLSPENEYVYRVARKPERATQPSTPNEKR